MHSAVFSVYSVVCCEFGGLGMRCATPSVCCACGTFNVWFAEHAVLCAKDPGCCAVLCCAVSLCHGVSCVCLAHDMLCGQRVVCPYKDEDFLLQGNKQ